MKQKLQTRRTKATKRARQKGIADDRWVNRFDRRLDKMLKARLAEMAAQDQFREFNEDFSFLRRVGIDPAKEDLRAAIRDAVRSGDIVAPKFDFFGVFGS